MRVCIPGTHRFHPETAEDVGRNKRPGSSGVTEVSIFIKFIRFKDSLKLFTLGILFSASKNIFFRQVSPVDFFDAHIF